MLFHKCEIILSQWRPGCRQESAPANKHFAEARSGGMAMAKSRGAPKRIAKEITLRQFRYFAAAGFGVLTDMVYRPWSLEGKQIEVRAIASAVPDMEVGMMWQAGRKLDKPADALREFLIHACGSRARCSRSAGARAGRLPRATVAAMPVVNAS
ncbi:helix-turn-helix motif protein (plasmid) [Cupriavidus necator N-1]|uniref:Helix-turn-helix motif protein n=2 Tax=Cupriavidus necator TaxID=106590 RepID=F8GVZ9_CUPNN|nr:helix-turn-helix motif protein [Cupriavidus necator N-1]